MFPANPFRTSQQYRGAIPFEQFMQKHPTIQPTGQLGGRTVHNVPAAAMPASIQAALPGAVSAAPPPAPANQWVQPVVPAPHPVGQPVIGQRLQPAPQPAHQWVRGTYR